DSSSPTYIYNLTGLSISSGTLTPSFSTATTGYTSIVGNGVSSITVTPTATGNGGAITVNGSTVLSGNASDSISLSVGSNAITVVITPTGGSATTYTITVTRAAAPTYDLTILAISQGSLSPSFDTNTTSYTVAVGYSISSMTVTPTGTGDGGTITVDGSAVSSGNASDAISLSVGSNTITVTITPTGGSATTYTITVTRAAATYTLTGLSLSTGTLSPSFSTGTTSYTTTVANAVSSITVTPTAIGDEGIITVDGSTVSSGNASGAISLSVGANAISVVITPTGGSGTTYTVTVTRQAAPPANTYYVSTAGSDTTGDGSQSNPWATPAKGAVNVSAGDTLIILGGTYVVSTDPDDVITPTNSGTSGNPITIQGESGNRPILKGTNNIIRAIDLSGLDYITVENIEITNNSLNNFRNAVEIYTPATNIILKDLYIHHIDEFGVNLQDVDTLTIEDCTIEYCGFGAIGSPDMGEGGGWKSITIDNCDLSYNGHYYQGIIDNPANPYGRPDGIGLEEGPGPIEVKNCLVEHNVGDGIDLKLSNCHVHENTVANNSCDGIKLWAGVTTVENNLVYGTGDGVGGASPWAALVIGAPAGETFTIINNTFHGNPSRQGYISYMQYDELTNINITLRNNIFDNAQGLVWLASQITGYTIENNLFNRDSSSDQIYVGGSDRTVSQLNALSNCSGNITGDPKFVSPAWGTTGDYHLQSGSPAIDAGTSTGAPSIDLDGTSRPVGSADDIGAYEQ
ncbi:MAG: cadherin-like beta sandwich domain-containing protein, partial [Candidatus Saganbacteria bacterium]|nr:cadherin-like beta sandwich domain-containing protein [Candidatus Saganbacteria bacterium]